MQKNENKIKNYFSDFRNQAGQGTCKCSPVAVQNLNQVCRLEQTIGNHWLTDLHHKHQAPQMARIGRLWCDPMDIQTTGLKLTPLSINGILDEITLGMRNVTASLPFCGPPQPTSERLPRGVG